MPHGFVDKGRRVYTDRFLILHAAIEKALMRWLGLRCRYAHEIALQAERAAVRGEGIDVQFYENFLQLHWKPINHEQLVRIPNTLDLAAYRGQMEDKLLQRLGRAMVPVLRPARWDAADCEGDVSSHATPAAWFQP